MILNRVKPLNQNQNENELIIKKTTSNNNNFLDKNKNQTVDSKIPIYRDLFNRNPNNIPQPAMVDWQAIRMGLLPAPLAPPIPQILPPPPSQTPSPEKLIIEFRDRLGGGRRPWFRLAYSLGDILIDPCLPLGPKLVPGTLKPVLSHDFCDAFASHHR